MTYNVYITTPQAHLKKNLNRQSFIVKYLCNLHIMSV